MTAVEVRTSPFAGAAGLYVERGWWPLPLPPNAKTPPPLGLTGSRSGAGPTPAQVAAWITAGGYEGHPIGNVALRMPPGVIGIDVDDGYAKDGATKVGGRSLAELEMNLGALPATYSSTARGWGESRIRFYRVPPGTRLRSAPVDSIEIVQHHHRYAVAWPSVHPETHTVYQWFDWSGEALDEPPPIEELTELPSAWIDALRSVGDATSSAVPALPEEVQTFYDESCGIAMPGALKGVDAVLDRAGARHDRLVVGACMVAREALAGWYPMAQAEAKLRTWWASVMDDERRLHGSEFDDAIAWAVAQARAGVGSPQTQGKIAQAERARAAVAPVDDEIAIPTPKFFGSKEGLLARKLIAAVLDEGPIVAGLGHELWRYSDGVYLADGADEVRRRTRVLLGERWRGGHANVVIEALGSDLPTVTDEQPTSWINCRNGLLDWRTGLLEAHRPEVPSTYQLSVPWSSAAICPTVDAWLAEVAPDDAIELIWEVIGVAIYADMPFHRAIMIVGPGRNGKGTLLRLVQALIGRRHVSNVTLQSLSENRFAGADLFGKVANICGDLDARALARTDVFKMATGGDTLTVERKFGQQFSFRNRATMLFSANELPGSADLSDGFFSRWVIVPFDRLKLAPGTEDPTIEMRMNLELKGVLVSAVAGLRRLMERGGFATPGSVAAATASYRDHADPVRRFVEDMMEVTGDHDHRVPRTRVYESYTSWCRQNGNKPLGAGKFYSHLGAAFPQVDARFVSMGVRFITGAYMSASVDAF